MRSHCERSIGEGAGIDGMKPGGTIGGDAYGAEGSAIPGGVNSGTEPGS